MDDSKVVHELARMALEDVAGWDVRCAESGPEALGVVASEQPDAVLLDVEMPDMDGPATVAALRAHSACAATPIVFLTAHDDLAELQRLAGLDVAGVLPKPFEVSQLAGRLADMLGWPR